MRLVLVALLFLVSPILSYSQTTTSSGPKNKGVKIEIKKDKKHNCDIRVEYQDCKTGKMVVDQKHLPAEPFDPKNETKTILEYRAYPLVSKDGYFQFKIGFGYEDHVIEQLRVVKYLKKGDCYDQIEFEFNKAGGEGEGETWQNLFFSKDGRALLWLDKDEEKNNYEGSVYSMDDLSLVKTVRVGKALGDKMTKNPANEKVDGHRYFGVMDWVHLQKDYPF